MDADTRSAYLMVIVFLMMVVVLALGHPLSPFMQDIIPFFDLYFIGCIVVVVCFGVNAIWGGIEWWRRR